MSEREQNWYPIGEVGWFTGHVREGVEVTTGKLDLLRRALAEPYRLDDATVSRIIQVPALHYSYPSIDRQSRPCRRDARDHLLIRLRCRRHTLTLCR